MMKPKSYWVIQIENLETAETTLLKDRYGHKPEIFRSFSDAAGRCAKLNRQLANVGQRSSVLEKIDAEPKQTRLSQ